MRRPARTRDRAGIHGYAVAPELAWSGWRLMVPGGPAGGQYHGYTGDDTDHETTQLSGVEPMLPWRQEWGGTALLEGETVSDHVYRSPGEVRPRANASGGANVFREYQRKRTPGYGEAPGNYAALGMMDPCENAGSGMYLCRQATQNIPQSYDLPTRVLLAPTPVLTPRPIVSPVSTSPSPQIGWPAGATEPTLPIYAMPPTPGPVNTVAQPPPPSSPVIQNTIPVYSIPPVSPAPSPTVAASPADYLPATGQPLPGAAVASSGVDIGAWLTSSSIWSAVPNWVLVGGGLLLLFRGGGKNK